jgi:polyhydroxybutyrate depolymerase
MRGTRVWLALLPLAACGPAPVELGTADYAALDLPARCGSGEKPGPAGEDNRLSTAGGIRLGVRTPRNYDPTRAHPLLVVFAPAGHGRVRSERFAGLTRGATARGFVVAYADHRPLARATFDELGKVPALIAARWCVDERRVHFVGHSDGGTAAAAVAFLRTSTLPPAGLVISAAGIREQDLAQYACPPSLSVMLVHSREDQLFPPPAFGVGAARWWAACNQCGSHMQRSAEGCQEYAGCAEGRRTLYCETSDAHTRWPALSDTMLDFLAAARR